MYSTGIQDFPEARIPFRHWPARPKAGAARAESWRVRRLGDSVTR